MRGASGGIIATFVRQTIDTAVLQNYTHLCFRSQRLRLGDGFHVRRNGGTDLQGTRFDGGRGGRHTPAFDGGDQRRQLEVRYRRHWGRRRLESIYLFRIWNRRD